MKFQNFRLLKGSQKNYQIHYAIFKTIWQIFSKFCITFQCHETSLICKFLVDAMYTLDKMRVWNFKMSEFQQLIENLTNFLYHFLNYLADFFQILRHSSVSWNLTWLKIFSWCNVYFGWNEGMKFQNLRLSRACRKFSKFLVSFLELSRIFFPNFALLFSVMKSNSSAIFSWCNVYFGQNVVYEILNFQSFNACIKFNKFPVSFLKPSVSCSSNFASLLNVKTHKYSLSF